MNRTREKTFQEGMESILTSNLLNVESDEAGVQIEIEPEDAITPGEDLVVIAAKEANIKKAYVSHKKQTRTRELNFGYNQTRRGHISSMNFYNEMFRYNQP